MSICLSNIIFHHQQPPSLCTPWVCCNAAHRSPKCQAILPQYLACTVPTARYNLLPSLAPYKPIYLLRAHSLVFQESAVAWPVCETFITSSAYP